MPASFDSYKIFYYVAKHGNITRAASSLFLSQSTVSRALQSLESELGCRLFVRYRYGVRLTTEGELLYRHISSGCESFRSGEELLKQYLSLRSSELRVGVNDFVFQKYLLPALSEFSKICPETEISLSTQRYYAADEIYRMLDDGLLDVVFAYSPIPDAEKFSVQTVGQTHDVLVAGAMFREFRDREVSLAELKNCPFVARSAPDGSTSYLEQTFLQNGMSVKPKYHVDTIAHFIPLVRAGLCLAMLPEPVFRQLDDASGIFPLRLKEELPTRDLCIVTSRTKTVSSSVEEMIRCFRRQLPEYAEN